MKTSFNSCMKSIQHLGLPREILDINQKMKKLPLSLVRGFMVSPA